MHFGMRLSQRDHADISGGRFGDVALTVSLHRSGFLARFAPSQFVRAFAICGLANEIIGEGRLPVHVLQN